jgi:hypothetical protein
MPLLLLELIRIKNNELDEDITLQYKVSWRRWLVEEAHFLTPHLLYSNYHGGLSSFSPSVKVAMLEADIAASNVTYKDGIYSFSLAFVQGSKKQDS